MKILVVEDNFLAALELQDRLQKLGHQVVGPVGQVADALARVDRETFDAALVDIRVRGELSFPVARALRLKGCPVCFATGYTRLSSIPEDLQDVPFLEKPIEPEALRDALARLERQGSRGV